jgi:hypothetical protein
MTDIQVAVKIEKGRPDNSALQVDSISLRKSPGRCNSRNDPVGYFNICADQTVGIFRRLEWGSKERGVNPATP